jgi:uroporphyrin-III C-methyltransferase
MSAKDNRLSGRVILVGAGPGDPELLTIKAVRALQSADVVLHDDLVSGEILELVRPGARVVCVGKRGGCSSTPQQFIEQLMVREARAGNVVVRLKGGDPFVFGRGGEEMSALRAAGVAVDVVPGITSGLAAPASVGIPVTHRALAHGVALVTGHAAADEEPDWKALAASRLTLVIYMGTRRARELRESLVQAGMAKSTPVAIVMHASRPQQTCIVTTLDELMTHAGLASPAIIIVGDVAALGRGDQAVSLKAAGADVQI